MIQSVNSREPKFEPPEVFVGRASPIQAEVCAWLPLSDDFVEPQAYRLDGQFVGPETRFAHTLATRIPFATRGVVYCPVFALAAYAVVPDPCFWTPDLPFLYRAALEVRHGDQMIS